MPNCPRCQTLTNDDFAYCGACGLPRIVESLRAPRLPPEWLRPLQLILLGVLTLWLVVTLGVAYLREAKAVRDARTLLSDGKPQEAWTLLGPFLQEHPRHKQGLLLGGQATIRLDQVKEAKQFLGTLTEISPELGKQLGDDYRQTLTQRAQAVGCDAPAFLKVLSSAQSLGDSFPDSVTASLGGFVEACQKSGDTWGQVPYQLAEQGLRTDLIRKGYVPAIGRALGQARYSDAKALAQQAVRAAPDEIGEIKKVLDSERAKVAATIKTLSGLCQSLKNDPRYHPGDSWCLPEIPPAGAQRARDAWGKSFVYTAFAPNPGQTCHPGASFTSYGAGQATEGEERQSPAAGITCSFAYGSESWQVPERYWLESLQSDG